jgi:transposase
MTRRSKVYTSRQWMWNKYVKDKLSEEEIAKLAGCDQATINRWLRKLELKK